MGTSPISGLSCENVPQNVLTVLWWGQPTVREGQVFRMRVAYAFPDPRGDRDVVAASLTTYRRSQEADYNQPDVWEAEKRMLKKLGRK